MPRKIDRAALRAYKSAAFYQACIAGVIVAGVAGFFLAYPVVRTIAGDWHKVQATVLSVGREPSNFDGSYAFAEVEYAVNGEARQGQVGVVWFTEAGTRATVWVKDDGGVTRKNPYGDWRVIFLVVGALVALVVCLWVADVGAKAELLSDA